MKSIPHRSVYAMMPLEQHLDDASVENRLRTILARPLRRHRRVSRLHRHSTALSAISAACASAKLACVWPSAQCAARSLRVFSSRVCALPFSDASPVSSSDSPLSHFLAGMLYGITALDPITYASVVCLVLLVAALASLIPAVRAARIDPMNVLRDE